jgi:hypothetical protein
VIAIIARRLARMIKPTEQPTTNLLGSAPPRNSSSLQRRFVLRRARPPRERRPRPIKDQLIERLMPIVCEVRAKSTYPGRSTSVEYTHRSLHHKMRPVADCAPPNLGRKR